MKIQRVLSSRTYARAMAAAKGYLQDRQSLGDFSDQVMTKAEKYRSGPLRNLWDSIQALVRLLRAYATGDYRDVSAKTLLLMVTALVYFIIPTDLIPDILLGWGLVDDVTLLGWVIQSSRTELDKFKLWESKGQSMRQDQPTQTHYRIGGVDLNVYEWSGSGEPLVLFHATGFHGRCWDQVIRHLPQDTHVYALEFLGHGLSDNPQGGICWDEMSEDLIALLQQLELTDINLVGHSFGGYAAAMAAATLPGQIKRVMLLDPVIMSPEYLQMIEASLGSKEDHPVARRRNQWGSPEEMIEAFAAREPYKHWHPQVLDDYCRYGLAASEQDDLLELACPPLVEADIYVRSGLGSVYDKFGDIQAPVHIIRARDRLPEDHFFDFSPSPTWAQLHEQIKGATDIQLKDQSHFFPMEKPESLAALMGQWLADKALHWS
ncbi:MAG: hypothetical protein AseanaTS_26420 [Candidatus Pelagadaptatus aseana]|uniref:alpha/beta fold hydrolase n=1 Tax=Candidatus Pelagadaptatus aseana TaxID=3120508 RepID=UPI0039B13594